MLLSLYSSVSFKHPFGLAHTISIASAIGYDAIDIRGHSLDVPIIEKRHLNAVGYDMLGPERVNTFAVNHLKEHLYENKVKISGISCYNSLTTPKGILAESSLRQFYDMIDFAAELEIPWVRLIGYNENPFKGISHSRAEAKDLFIQRVRTLCEYGSDRNVGILLENGENSIPNSSKETIEIAEKVDHPNLGIVYDVLNALFEGLDPYDELKSLDGLIDIIHVKNAKMGSNKNETYSPKTNIGFKWTLLTEGDVDYNVIMQELKKQGFDKTIVCEYANPYKGMSRSYWDEMPNPYSWAFDAFKFLKEYS